MCDNVISVFEYTFKVQGIADYALFFERTIMNYLSL